MYDSGWGRKVGMSTSSWLKIMGQGGRVQPAKNAKILARNAAPCFHVDSNVRIIGI